MNTNTNEWQSDDSATRYKKILSMCISDGWLVISEGPSGAQLKKPRKMRTSTKIFLATGIIGLLAWGLGLILILLSVLDYYLLTKEQTYFLSRDRPMPIL